MLKEVSHQPEELKASRVAAMVSVVLAVFKLLAGVSAGSLSLMASGLDSIWDAVASFTGYLLLKMSLEPADAEHPYGHSRIESIASLAQGAFLIFIAVGLAYVALQRFDHLHEPEAVGLTLYVPAICSVATFVLWIYLGRVVEKTQSMVIEGDRLHYFSDLAGNVLLFVGFIVARVWHLYNVDAILTMVLSIFMFLGGAKIIASSIIELVDHADPDMEKNIELMLRDFYPEALGTTRIRSRRSGRRTAMDLELLSCRQLKFQDVHDISHKVQRHLIQSIPNLDLVIHSEPCRRQQCPTDEQCQYRLHKTDKKKT